MSEIVNSAHSRQLNRDKSLIFKEIKKIDPYFGKLYLEHRAPEDKHSLTERVKEVCQEVTTPKKRPEEPLKYPSLRVYKQSTGIKRVALYTLTLLSLFLIPIALIIFDSLRKSSVGLPVDLDEEQKMFEAIADLDRYLEKLKLIVSECLLCSGNMKEEEREALDNSLEKIKSPKLTFNPSDSIVKQRALLSISRIMVDVNKAKTILEHLAKIKGVDFKKIGLDDFEDLNLFSKYAKFQLESKLETMTQIHLLATCIENDLRIINAIINCPKSKKQIRKKQSVRRIRAISI